MVINVEALMECKRVLEKMDENDILCATKDTVEKTEGVLFVDCTRYCTALAEYSGEIFGGNDIVAVLVFDGRCGQ